MASVPVVKRCLQALAENYGKSDSWVESSLKLWSRGLSSIHDRDLIRGVEEWCQKQPKIANLARLKTTIEANPLRIKPAALAGCPACNSTGWRELARWHVRNEKVRADTFAAACDCPKGQALQSGTVLQWNEVVDHWRSNPWTEAVYHSTPERYHLTTQERHTPEQLEAMEQRAKERASVSGWSRVGSKR